MAKAKKSRTGLVVFLLVLILVVVACVVWLTISKSNGPVLVSIANASHRTITQSVSAIGKLQPEVMVKVSSEASGEIIYLGVHDGDKVAAGQLLVRIQPDLVQTGLQQSRATTEAAKIGISIAKSELDRSEADYKRITELAKKDFASREELDRARTAYESAAGRYSQAQSDYQRTQGALRQSQATANRTTIFAPMGGTVTYLGVEQGEKVVGTAQMQGTEMMRIADLNSMNAWVDVAENDIALVSVGDTARVRTDALKDVVFRGVVYEISHSPKTTAQGTQEEVVNFQVRIRLIDKDSRMRPGMSCSVDIETDTRTNALTVPIQAVAMKRNASQQQNTTTHDNDVPSSESTRKTTSERPPQIVWVYNNNSVQSRDVKTGISDKGYIEILSGLKPSEKIVVGPYSAISKLLSNGAKVKTEAPEQRQARFQSIRQKQQ